MLRKFFLLTLGFAGIILSGFSQTPGQITISASPSANPLNPDGDNFITSSGAPFTANETSEFELDWKAIPQLSAEPNNDLKSGAKCGVTDLVDNPSTGTDAAYIYYDDVDGIQDNGDDLIMYRIRAADEWSSGNFGYSILIDTDAQFGFSGVNADPNAVSGNPGFEIEVRVKTGSNAIFVDNVDGSTSGSLIRIHSLSSNYQQAYAYHNDPACSGDVVFHDFFIELSDLGISSQTGIRAAAATSQSGNSALSGSAADIGGANDNSYPVQDSIFVALIGNQNPTPPGNLGGGGVGFPVELIGFEANMHKGNISLNWATASESNNHFFSIYRSGDGDHFELLDRRGGAGNSSEMKTYEAVDENPLPGRNFYKLSQTDMDGTEHSLQTIEVLYTSREKLVATVYPNPTRGSVSLAFNEMPEENLSISVFDMNGRMHLKETLEANSANLRQLDLHDLVQGVYLIKIEGRTFKKTMRVLKQD